MSFHLCATVKHDSYFPLLFYPQINWNYKATDDVVKVEVWDVVDKGKESGGGGAADATTVDVYKNADAVVIMVDPTRKWTFEYAQETLQNIPDGLGVLILINFRDLDNRRVVSRKKIEQFMRKQGEHVRSTECSLLNCKSKQYVNEMCLIHRTHVVLSFFLHPFVFE